MDEHNSLIDKLQRLTSGECAALRREAGKCLAETNAQALAIFYRIAPPELSRKQQECWFASITIACLWKVQEVQVGKEFPVMLREYARRQGTGGMDRRFRSLLDTQWEEDGYLTMKLCRLARMLRSDNRNVMPDIDRLLSDLMHWNYDNRSVQLRWARHFYQPDASELQNKEES